MEANRDTPFAQLLITHVCSTWRKAAQNNTPRIWTLLYISVTAQSAAFTDHGPMITDWLNRSSLPIDIQVGTAKVAFGRSGVTFPPEIVDALIPFCPRVRALILRVPLKGFMPLFTLPCDSFPILAELGLSIRADSSTKLLKKQSISTFASAPLRKLEIRSSTRIGFLFADDDFLGLNKFTFDVTQLTSLHIDDPTTHNSWDFLHGCQNLVECTLRVRESHLFDSGLTRPVTLPVLEKLTVVSTNEEVLVQITLFVVLTTPALTDLYLDFSVSSYSVRTTLPRVLIEFQKRCDCPLTTLSLLCADALTNKDLSSLIDTYSFSLRSLTVIGKKIRPKTLLQRLVCKSKAKEALLPNLEFLRFSLESPSSDLSPSLLLDVVESRWSDANLARFHLDSRLSKVQIDKIVEKQRFLSLQDQALLLHDLDSDNSYDDDTSDEYVGKEDVVKEDMKEESWLAAKMTKAERKRLERLQSEGFQVLETTFFTQNRGLPLDL